MLRTVGAVFRGIASTERARADRVSILSELPLDTFLFRNAFLAEIGGQGPGQLDRRSDEQQRHRQRHCDRCLLGGGQLADQAQRRPAERGHSEKDRVRGNQRTCMAHMRPTI